MEEPGVCPGDMTRRQRAGEAAGPAASSHGPAAELQRPPAKLEPGLLCHEMV